MLEIRMKITSAVNVQLLLYQALFCVIWTLYNNNKFDLLLLSDRINKNYELSNAPNFYLNYLNQFSPFPFFTISAHDTSKFFLFSLCSFLSFRSVLIFSFSYVPSPVMDSECSSLNFPGKYPFPTHETDSVRPRLTRYD